jgi:hypothetical protein
MRSKVKTNEALLFVTGGHGSYFKLVVWLEKFAFNGLFAILLGSQ